MARSGPVPGDRGRSLLYVALTTLALFGCLGVVISAHPRTLLDDAVRGVVLGWNSPAGAKFFSVVSTVGSVTPMIVYAFIVVALVALFRRSLVPLTILFAPMAAVFAYLGTKSLFLRTRPSGVGNAFEGTYSFPSAHATTSSAVCFAVAYLLYREGVLSRAVAATAGTAVSLVIGFSRIYLDVHWTTDVIGGWCLGFAIGAVAATLYESAGGAGVAGVSRQLS